MERSRDGQSAGARRVSTQPPVRSLATSPSLGLVVSSPVLIWAAIGRHDFDTYYAFGPYHVDYTLEIVTLWGAVLLFGTSVLVLVRQRNRPAAAGLSGRSVLFLLMSVSFCAWAWRAMTAGVGGANIGAGLLAMAGPVIVAALLVGAVIHQHNFRSLTRRRLAGLLASSALVVPLLYIVLGHLK